MPILRKLKSLLGADDADKESERDVTVTVEHDPENEAAVKGADVEDSQEGVGEDAESEADDDAASDDEPAEADAEEPVEIPDAEGGTTDADDGTDTESAADAESTADDEDADASGSDESVDVLNGIGPAYAERLENAGVETVGQLAAADAATLAEDADIAEGRIQGWIDQASEY